MLIQKLTQKSFLKKCLEPCHSTHMLGGLLSQNQKGYLVKFDILKTPNSISLEKQSSTGENNVLHFCRKRRARWTKHKLNAPIPALCSLIPMVCLVWDHYFDAFRKYYVLSCM